jgi:hypothetical protein
MLHTPLFRHNKEIIVETGRKRVVTTSATWGRGDVVWRLHSHTKKVEKGWIKIVSGVVWS